MRYPYSGIQSPEVAREIAEAHNNELEGQNVKPVRALDVNVALWMNEGTQPGSNGACVWWVWMYACVWVDVGVRACGWMWVCVLVGVCGGVCARVCGSVCVCRSGWCILFVNTACRCFDLACSNWLA